MADVFNLLWTGVEKFHNFLLTPAGVKFLNIAFISSILFLILLSISFLFRQEFLVILSLILSATAGGAIYILSIYSTPLPDHYGIIDKFLIATGAKHVLDPDTHITAGTGEDKESGFINALDSAFTTALGADTDGIFKNVITKDYKEFEKKFRSLFKIIKEKKIDEKEMVEVKWTLPVVRAFILRNGFSPTPTMAMIEFLKNPTSTPSQVLIDQISLLHKTKSMYFKNGMFYATCDAITRELKNNVFKTTAGEIMLKMLSYKENTTADNKRVCHIKVESVILNQGD